MKKLKTLLLMLLVAIFTIQVIGCDKSATDRGIIDGPHMSERVYQRMDEEAIYNLIDEIYVLLETDGNIAAIEEKREAFFNEYYSKAFTMNTIASINYDKDVTDEYWQEESVWALNFAQQFQNDTLKLEQAILSSEFYGEYFTKLLGEDYAASILVAETDSEEQLAILAEISSLEAQYSSLYASFKYTKIPSVYIKLVTLRNQYAQGKKNSDGEYYANYMDYAYENIYGREYTPDEVVGFRNAVKKNLATIRNRLIPHASDASVSADQAFSAKDLTQYMPTIINNTVPKMMDSWNYMIEKELYDFNYSNKKANTSYVTTFSEYGDAFMFINPSNKVVSDFSTLIHEFGHYNEKFMADPMLATNGRSYDLAETHSQAFELISMPVMENVFEGFKTDNLYESYVFNTLINGVWSMMINCAFDEFEYTVYNANPEELTSDFLKSAFNTAWGHFWTGSGSYNFYDIPHFFSSPAYCISYSVSMVFSAEIWASDDPINNYVSVVKHGSNNTLSNVCENVGLLSPLTDEAVLSVKEHLLAFIRSTYGW